MNPKFYKWTAVFCWLGTAITVFMEAYMLRMTDKYPGMTELDGSVRMIGALLLVWLAVSTFFTVRAWKENRK